MENNQHHKAEHYVKEPLEHDPSSKSSYDNVRKLLKEAEERFTLVQKEQEREERRKFPLDARLRESIVGQQGAISTVASG